MDKVILIENLSTEYTKDTEKTLKYSCFCSVSFVCSVDSHKDNSVLLLITKKT